VARASKLHAADVDARAARPLSREVPEPRAVCAPDIFPWLAQCAVQVASATPTLHDDIGVKIARRV